MPGALVIYRVIATMAMTTAEFDDAHKPKATIWKILSSARLTR